MWSTNLVAVAFALLAPSSPIQVADDWAATPEASFLTPEERRIWKTLDSAERREEFQRNYWRRRDPTPDTGRNEFEEEILARIRAADDRFGTPDRRGSRTARGA